MKPQVSVCIPVYQGASTLALTLRSVLASDHQNFEVIVRDNGSTDGTSQVVARFDDPRLRYIRSEETIPLPQNWQAAVEESRGELIKVVCADDLIHPHCLRSQAAALTDQAISLVACRRDIIDGNGSVLSRSAGLPHLLGRRTATEVARTVVRFGINPVGESACVMFRRRDFDAIGGFDRSTVFPMDIDAWLRLLCQGDMLGQPESYAAFRIWPDSLSSRHNRKQLDEHLQFLWRVADEPRYAVSPSDRRRISTAAQLSWHAWAVRQWIWAKTPRQLRDSAHSWR